MQEGRRWRDGSFARPASAQIVLPIPAIKDYIDKTVYSRVTPAVYAPRDKHYLLNDVMECVFWLAA